MPIKGVYSWTESSDQLLISIHLKGVSPKKVDIFCTENILKVNYSPYIVDILLYSAIDPLKNKAKVKEGILNITLFKRDPVKWGILENQNEGNESQRVESIRNHEILEKELSEKRKDKKIEEERHSLRKQMALDESEKNRIENLKSDEKQCAEDEVYQALSKFHTSNDGQNTSIASTTNKSTKISNKSINSKEFSNLNVSDKYFDYENGDEEDLVDSTNIFAAEKSSSKQKKEDNEDEEGEEEDIKYIPPPREAFGMSSAKYDINFTPRIFPTPVRESKLVEEEDWIAKNRRHLKKHAVYGKNIGDLILIQELFVLNKTNIF
jgi:dyslexia susceptibility 1 candidate gene 1 protein